MSEVLRTLRQIGRVTAFVGQLGVPAMGALPPLSTADISPNQPENAVKPVVWPASPNYLRGLQPEISLPGKIASVKPQAPQKQEPLTLTRAICLGDVTGDGRTDIKDLVKVAADYGQEPKTLEDGLFGGDLNGDGQIGIADLTIVASDYGCQEEATPTPLPIETPSLIHESDQIARFFPEFQERITTLSANDRVAIIGANGEEIFFYNLTGKKLGEGGLLRTMWLLANKFAGTSMDIKIGNDVVQINSQRRAFETATFVALADKNDPPSWASSFYGQTSVDTDERGIIRVGSYAIDREGVSISQLTIAELCQAFVGFDAYQEVGCMSIAYAVQSALSGIRYVDYEANLSHMFFQTQERTPVYFGKVPYDFYMEFADLSPFFE